MRDRGLRFVLIVVAAAVLAVTCGDDVEFDPVNRTPTATPTATPTRVP